MAKKKYVKPMMVSEAFVPNEYVAACAWEEGAELTATCAGNNITIKLGTNQGGDVWQATPIDAYGNVAGGTEMLYPTSKGYYVFCGSITTGHTNTTSGGEFMPIGNGVVGDSEGKYGQYTVCDCELEGQSGAGVGAAHHHLTNVRTKNHS